MWCRTEPAIIEIMISDQCHGKIIHQTFKIIVQWLHASMQHIMMLKSWCPDNSQGPPQLNKIFDSYCTNCAAKIIEQPGSGQGACICLISSSDWRMQNERDKLFTHREAFWDLLHRFPQLCWQTSWLLICESEYSQPHSTFLKWSVEGDVI